MKVKAASWWLSIWVQLDCKTCVSLSSPWSTSSRHSHFMKSLQTEQKQNRVTSLTMEGRNRVYSGEPKRLTTLIRSDWPFSSVGAGAKLNTRGLWRDTIISNIQHFIWLFRGQLDCCVRWRWSYSCNKCLSPHLKACPRKYVDVTSRSKVSSFTLRHDLNGAGRMQQAGLFIMKLFTEEPQDSRSVFVIMGVRALY